VVKLFHAVWWIIVTTVPWERGVKLDIAPLAIGLERANCRELFFSWLRSSIKMRADLVDATEAARIELTSRSRLYMTTGNHEKRRNPLHGIAAEARDVAFAGLSAL